jgi:uncharacterized protein DUF4440
MHVSNRAFAPALVLASALLGVAGPAMAAPASGPVAVVKQATADFNKGDMKAAEAGFANDTAITDEFAPYQWHGPGALATWLDGYSAFIKSAGWSDVAVTIGSIPRSDIDGDAAYVVAREVVTYTQHGRPMRESGTQVFTLHKGAEGWKITGSAWAGSRAQPVAPKPASSAAAPATGPAPATAPTKKP